MTHEEKCQKIIEMKARVRRDKRTAYFHSLYENSGLSEDAKERVWLALRNKPFKTGKDIEKAILAEKKRR
jgi:uncharacterized protein YqjF (DUF2071 family)